MVYNIVKKSGKGGVRYPKRMRCWHCGFPMIWGGDHAADTDEEGIESNFSCPNCPATALVTLIDDGFCVGTALGRLGSCSHCKGDKKTCACEV